MRSSTFFCLVLGILFALACVAAVDASSSNADPATSSPSTRPGSAPSSAQGNKKTSVAITKKGKAPSTPADWRTVAEVKQKAADKKRQEWIAAAKIAAQAAADVAKADAAALGLIPDSTPLVLQKEVPASPEAEQAARRAASIRPSIPKWGDSVPESFGGVGMEVSELYLRSRQTEKAPRMHLGRGEDTFSFGLNAQGQFSVGITEKDAVQDIMVISTGGIAANNVIARSIAVNTYTVNKVPQWILHFENIFDSFKADVVTDKANKIKPEPAANAKSLLEVDDSNDLDVADSAASAQTAPSALGWTAAPITSCSGLNILTVEEASKHVSKTFRSLPPHSHVRITATAHLWDDWQGETAYLKVDNSYVWTESHELRNGAHSLSVCGNPVFPETKFTVPVEVSFPHKSSEIQLTFGSTVEKNSAARFGVSSISIFYRSLPDNNVKTESFLKS